MDPVWLVVLLQQIPCCSTSLDMLNGHTVLMMITCMGRPDRDAVPVCAASRPPATCDAGHMPKHHGQHAVALCFLCSAGVVMQQLRLAVPGQELLRWPYRKRVFLCWTSSHPDRHTNCALAEASSPWPRSAQPPHDIQWVYGKTSVYLLCSGVPGLHFAQDIRDVQARH